MPMPCIAGWGQKTWAWSPHSDHHELVLVFMPCNYWLDIDYNDLCV